MEEKNLVLHLIFKLANLQTHLFAFRTPSSTCHFNNYRPIDALKGFVLTVALKKQKNHKIFCPRQKDKDKLGTILYFSYTLMYLKAFVSMVFFLS